MPRDARKYLRDIIDAAHLIASATASKTLDDYRADAFLRSGVERQFEIIGEAVRQLLGARPDLEPRITSARKIIAFRNQLIHGYWFVRHETVWGVIESEMHVLRAEVEEILREAEHGSAP